MSEDLEFINWILSGRVIPKTKKGESKMLEDIYVGPQSIGGGMSRGLEQCKPDYETMISNQTETLRKEEIFRDALLLYFQDKQARKEMAELIGEMVTKCNLLRRSLDALVKQQEEDGT